MSRVEENDKLHLPNSFRDDIQVQIAQAKFLEDISRSLAVIADSLDIMTKNSSSAILPDFFRSNDQVSY